MPSDTFSELVANAITDAQRPLIGVIENLRNELAEARRELQALREASGDESPRESDLVYLNLAQVADRLGVSKRTARRWLDSGKLPHVRLPGGGIRVSIAALERTLNESRLADCERAPNGDQAGARH